MTKFEEKPIATVKMIPTSDGNEIKFKTSSALGSYLISKGEADLYLKSQLQQQALPVVPDFVDKFLKSKPIFNIVKYPIPIEIITWANKQTGYMDLEINITYLVKLKANGYTVEKPQLFYLKHIDMSKADKECDWYLITDYVKLCHEWVGKNLKPKDDDFKFTQQEIDSMETGSYEQIEVAE